MEDIIDIIVTETTNLIEITSQPTDEIIDVNIIDNREDITLNVTPSVVEININSLTGNFGVNWGDIEGTLADQTDLQNVLNAKADLVDGKVPSSQLPSYVDDVIEVANYAALPVTGEVGKIYITLDTNFIYRWSGSTYIEIKDSSAVWGAITGTLSSQTDLQSALDAKVPYTGATGNVNLGEYGATVGYLGFDTTPTSTPTGIGTTYWDSFYRTLSLIDGDGDTTLQIGQEQRVLVHNNTGSTLTDGQVVYVIGSTGELPSVALASNTSETTSSVTFGIVTESIAHGANGFITTSGIIHGLNTNAYDEGAAIYLGSTAGTFTQTKPVAPANSVLVGYIIKKSGGNGSIFVKIQNGYELEELHDVLITSKANNDGLFYESSTSLWKNKSIATVLGGTPITGSGATGYYARFTSSNVISDGFIQTTSNITYVEGMGLSTGSGLDIEGSFGGGSDGLKLRSYDETTGKAYIEFFNTSGNFRLGLEGSIGGGILPGSTAYATVLTSGLTAKNLEFGTNNTKRLTLDGTTGAATFTSSVTTSALYVTGMTSGSGALYYNSGANRVTVANYNASGTVVFEVNGGSTALTLNSNLSATFASTLSATGATLTGALSGTSATFSATSADYVMTLANVNDSAQGLLVRATDNDSSLYLLSLQSSNTTTGQTWVDRFNVTKSGNVGIGISSPSRLLHINASSDTRFLITDSAVSSTTGTYYRQFGSNSAIVNQSNGTFQLGTNDSYFLTATASGNVGIGTTAPAVKLEIQGASNQIDSYGQLGIITTDGQAADKGGQIMFGGFYNGASQTVFGGLSAKKENSTSGNFAGYLQFITSTNGVGNTEKMRIRSNGVITIGAVSGTSGILDIKPGAATSDGVTLSATYTGSGSYGPFIFHTSDTERMRITSGGNVGIGTTSPTEKLSVIGNIYTEIASGNNSLLMKRVTNDTKFEISVQESRTRLRTWATANDRDILFDTDNAGTTRMTITGGGQIFMYNLSSGAGTNAARYSTATGQLTYDTSSARYKDNIRDSVYGLSDVLKMRSAMFEYKEDNRTDVGLIAEELYTIIPELVGIDKSGKPDSVSYDRLVSVLIKSVQELKAELDTLKNK